MLAGGVIGIGGIGKWHGAMLQDTGKVKVQAVCDVNEKMAEVVEERFDAASFYADPDEFFDVEDLDLVSIALPHNLHAEFAIRCLENDTNVVVEKPMATTWDDAKAMMEAAEKSEADVTVFHNRRLDGWYLTAKTAIDQGLLGKVFEINIQLSGFGKSSTWRGNREATGGVMFDWGAHFVDWALNLKDSDVATVSGYHYTRPGHTEQIQDHGRLSIRYEDDTCANIVISKADHYDSPWRYKILGEQGTLLDKWEDTDNTLEVINHLEGGQKSEMVIDYAEAEVQEFYDNVVEHIERGTPLMVSAESGAKVINVLDTATKSSDQGGKPLSLQD